MDGCVTDGTAVLVLMLLVPVSDGLQQFDNMLTFIQHLKQHFAVGLDLF